MSMHDLNNMSPSPQPGPQSDMLSTHLFERDIPEIKIFEFHILDSSENMVIESLTLLRKESLHNGDGHFVELTLELSQLVFDITLNFG